MAIEERTCHSFKVQQGKRSWRDADNLQDDVNSLRTAEIACRANERHKWLRKGIISPLFYILYQ